MACDSASYETNIWEEKIKEFAEGRSYDIKECIDDLVDSRHEHEEGVNYIDLELLWNDKRHVLVVPVTFEIDENENENFTFY